MSADDWKTLAIGGLGLVCALLGWWGNVLWASINQHRREHNEALTKLRTEHTEAVRNILNDHAALELHLAENFVRKDDLKERLQEVMQPLKEALDEIKAWMRGNGSKP